MPAWQMGLYALVLLLPQMINLWAIWHAFNRLFNPPHERLIWVGVAVFLPVIGGLIYLIFGMKRGKKLEDVTASQDRSPE
ncbi:MAG: PLDc_N domain-containing protein [Desulfovibrio sp.]|nr:MAG: PLDc_N domain-containing protein [Desulfovibrio sp.]